MNNKKVIQIKTPELQEYQKVVVENIKQNREDTIHTILSPRQMGKSLLIEMLLLECSVNHENQTSIVVEPTLSQARKMANELYNHIKNIPIYQSYNSQLLEIKFTNGSQILFKSSEQGEVAIRGYTISKFGYLIIDEAAYCSDAFFYAATPLCNANKASILLFSTPRWKSGFFYDFYIANKENCFSYDWSLWKNPFLSEDKFEMLKATMPAQLFLADYCGKFMESTSDVFGAFENILSNDYVMNGDYCMGIDWGTGKASANDNSDYTAISVLNSEKQQVLLEYFNDKDESETISYIADIIQKMGIKKAVVESNSIGSIFLSLLRKEVSKRHLNCVIKDVNLTNDKKNEIIDALIVNVQNGTIQLLNDNELKMEMSVLKREKTKSGKTTYNAQSGYHDDCILATCYSLDGLKINKYNFR